MWPLSRRIMMRMHDITPDAAAESRSILESELDWLDSTLADNRRYLSGDRFSRADITVASLLAFFARPREMPTYREMSIPAALLADRERWRDRPVMRWVVAQYVGIPWGRAKKANRLATVMSARLKRSPAR